MLQQAPSRPLHWSRFIDDISSIWVTCLKTILTFYEFINSFHSTIKFTMEHSNSSIAFLDIKQHIDDQGKIDTDLYKKPTDTNQYLHFTSSHPRHMKTGIPYGLALRICRICTKTEWRDAVYWNYQCFSINGDIRSILSMIKLNAPRKYLDKTYLNINNKTKIHAYHLSPPLTLCTLT